MRPNRKRALSLSAAFTVTLAVGPVAAQSLVRRPYVQSPTPSSVILVWTTDVPTDSQVRTGPSPQSLGAPIDLATPVTQHEVTIEGLTPDTRYYYSVGTTSATLEGADATHYFETAPAAGTQKKFRAWIVGDSGYNATAPRDVRDAMLTHVGAYRPHLFLHMGDMAYESGTKDEFTNNFFGNYPMILRNTPVWPALGNHEGVSSDSGTQSGPYYTAFVLPTAGQAGGEPSGTEAYYSFDYANVHFVVLDSYDSSRSPHGAMLTWLATDLAATSQDWIIAFWHHPPYSKGTHDSDVEVSETDMRTNALPILEAAGVDLILSGHSHVYERSYLVDGAYDTPTTAGGHILDPGDGRPLGDGPYTKLTGLGAHDGTVYVVAGHGAYAGSNGVHPLMYFTEARSGSCLLDVQGNRLGFSNVRSDGVVSDHFSLIKGQGLVVAAPDGGELLTQGSTYEIRWATSGSIPDVRLEYSTDDGASYTTIASSIPNTGHFTWTVPATGSSRALVRVSDAFNPAVFDESNAGFTLQAASQLAIYFGDYWAYNDRGVDQGNAWLDATFDDSSWSAGYAQLGYGDGDEVTTLVHAVPAYPSAYFRKVIQVDGQVTSATLEVVHDDGVIVWVNGTQVFSRYTGSSSYSAYATSGSLDNEHSTTSIPLSPNPFIVGNNVIAAMVKQSGPGSTDLSFDMQLTLSTTAPSDGGGSSGSSSSSSSSTTTSSSSTTTSSSSSSTTTTTTSSSSSTTTSSSSTTTSSSDASSTGASTATGSSPGADPICVTLRRGLAGAVQDATIWQATPTWSDGASSTLYTGTGTGGFRAALLWFNLSIIPSDATVISATLTLSQGYKTAPSIVRVHEVLSSWSEATVTWNSLNGSYSPTVIASFLSGGGTGNRTVDLTGLVQDWVSGIPNDGLLLEEDPVLRTEISSSESSTADRRPKLDVCYLL